MSGTSIDPTLPTLPTSPTRPASPAVPSCGEVHLPWLPPGRTLVLPGRGEVFYRHHVHPDPTRPLLLLLHGWTASADLQFFTAYEALAEHYSFVAIDHRGHGRGLRADVPFQLEDAADDAAALVEALGVGPVVTVGYSMGGPISLLVAQRHPHLVRAMVVEATALEWRANRWERLRWKAVYLVGALLRSWIYPRSLRYGVKRFMGPGHQYEVYTPWLLGEMRRSDTFQVVEAGRALSRFDARPWAGSLGIPAGVLVTTRDHLVPPVKQRALAQMLHATVVDVEGDHLVPWSRSQQWVAAMLDLLQRVTA